MKAVGIIMATTSSSTDGEVDTRKTMHLGTENAPPVNTKSFLPPDSSEPSESELTESDEMSIMLDIFEIGLKHGTPKLLLSLMPNSSQVNSEHVKSHLQKRRNNRSRSRQEFIDYYNKEMKADFEEWVGKKGFEAYGNPLDMRNKVSILFLRFYYQSP